MTHFCETMQAAAGEKKAKLNEAIGLLTAALEVHGIKAAQDAAASAGQERKAMLINQGQSFDSIIQQQRVQLHAHKQQLDMQKLGFDTVVDQQREHFKATSAQNAKVLKEVTAGFAETKEHLKSARQEIMDGRSENVEHHGVTHSKLDAQDMKLITVIDRLEYVTDMLAAGSRARVADVRSEPVA
jgi:hypothetical protein